MTRSGNDENLRAIILSRHLSLLVFDCWSQWQRERNPHASWWWEKGQQSTCVVQGVLMSESRRQVVCYDHTLLFGPHTNLAAPLFQAPASKTSVRCVRPW